MRDIIFKGKRIDNGDWIYGGTLIQFLDDGVRTAYMPEFDDKCEATHDDFGNIEKIEHTKMYMVDLESIEQYKKVENGIKIFERVE